MSRNRRRRGSKALSDASQAPRLLKLFLSRLRLVHIYPSIPVLNMRTAIPLASILFATTPAYAAYNLIRDYSGTNFFTGWEFYGNYDNLTNGTSLLSPRYGTLLRALPPSRTCE